MQVCLRKYLFSLGLNISCKGLFYLSFFSFIADYFCLKFTGLKKQNHSVSLISVTFWCFGSAKKLVNIKASGHFQNIGKSIFLKEYFFSF